MPCRSCSVAIFRLELKRLEGSLLTGTGWHKDGTSHTESIRKQRSGELHGNLKLRQVSPSGIVKYENTSARGREKDWQTCVRNVYRVAPGCEQCVRIERGQISHR